MVVYLILIITNLLAAGTAAVFARQQNRDPVRWFYIGLLSNVLAIALILLAGKDGQRRRL